MLVLSLDLGTSNLKGALYDLDGNEVAFKSLEYNLLLKAKGIVEVDVKEYWKKIVYIIRYLISSINNNSEKIVAIVTSSQGETIVPINKNGEPLYNAIVWIDERTKAEAEEISKNFDVIEYFNKTGLPEVNFSWPATRILWFKKNEPEIFKNVFKFLLIEDYIIFKLTGNFYGEATVYNGSYYFDILEFKFIEPILEYIGITPNLLPKIQKPGSYVGDISIKASEETGLTRNTKVIIGAMDQFCGAIGAGNIKEGIATETTGSAFSMIVTTKNPIFNYDLKLPCYIHAIPGYYAIQPYSFTGGMVLKWFKDNFCSDEIKIAKKNNRDVFEILDELAAKEPPGNDGLIMLPHLTGAFYPEYNPNAKAVFFGIGINHGKGNFVRAILEALGFMIRVYVESFKKLGININKIISMGGGSKSDLWCQIKSDISNLIIEVPKYKETALLGAAILAFLAIGAFDNIEKICNKFISFEKIYYPNKNNLETYSNSFKKYKSLYYKLESLF